MTGLPPGYCAAEPAGTQITNFGLVCWLRQIHEPYHGEPVSRGPTARAGPCRRLLPFRPRLPCLDRTARRPVPPFLRAPRDARYARDTIHGDDHARCVAGLKPGLPALTTVYLDAAFPAVPPFPE